MKDKNRTEIDLTMLAYAALEAIRKDYNEEQQTGKKEQVSA